MRLRVAPRNLPEDLGRPELPGSKSHTQRALVLAGFLPGEWHLAGALRSEDTEVLATALTALGARIEWSDAGARVIGRTSGRLDAEVDLAENGTALRMLLVLVPMLGGKLRIDGHEGLRRRPIEPALDVLKQMGARVSGRSLPITVDGAHAREAQVGELDAGLTTQVASGFLLGRALGRGQGSLLRLFGRGVPETVTVARPTAPGYLQVTRRVLEQFGYRVDESRQDGKLTFALRGRPRSGGEVAIPADPSARAFPLALAALHGRDASGLLPRVPHDPHPDWEIEADLRALREAGEGELTLDLQSRPDCVPAVATVAAARSGETRLPDLPALRGKESDRLQAMSEGLQAAGALCEVVDDGLRIRGPLPGASSGSGEAQGPRHLPTAPDHRVVMSLALLGTVLPGGVVIDNAVAARKSWPGFLSWLERVAEVTLE